VEKHGCRTMRNARSKGPIKGSRITQGNDEGKVPRELGQGEQEIKIQQGRKNTEAMLGINLEKVKYIAR